MGKNNRLKQSSRNIQRKEENYQQKLDKEWKLINSCKNLQPFVAEIPRYNSVVKALLFGVFPIAAAAIELTASLPRSEAHSAPATATAKSNQKKTTQSFHKENSTAIATGAQNSAVSTFQVHYHAKTSHNHFAFCLLDDKNRKNQTTDAASPEVKLIKPTSFEQARAPHQCAKNKVREAPKPAVVPSLHTTYSLTNDLAFRPNDNNLHPLSVATYTSYKQTLDPFVLPVSGSTLEVALKPNLTPAQLTTAQAIIYQRRLLSLLTHIDSLSYHITTDLVSNLQKTIKQLYINPSEVSHMGKLLGDNPQLIVPALEYHINNLAFLPEVMRNHKNTVLLTLKDLLRPLQLNNNTNFIEYLSKYGGKATTKFFNQHLDAKLPTPVAPLQNLNTLPQLLSAADWKVMLKGVKRHYLLTGFVSLPTTEAISHGVEACFQALIPEVPRNPYVPQYVQDAIRVKKNSNEFCYPSPLAPVTVSRNQLYNFMADFNQQQYLDMVFHLNHLEYERTHPQMAPILTDFAATTTPIYHLSLGLEVIVTDLNYGKNYLNTTASALLRKAFYTPYKSWDEYINLAKQLGMIASEKLFIELKELERKDQEFYNNLCNIGVGVICGGLIYSCFIVFCRLLTKSVVMW